MSDITDGDRKMIQRGIEQAAKGDVVKYPPGYFTDLVDDDLISRKAAIEALQSQLDAMPQSVTTDTKGHLKREMDFEQGARGCLMHNIEMLKSLGAAEPPTDGDRRDLISRRAAIEALPKLVFGVPLGDPLISLGAALSTIADLPSAAEPPSAPAPATWTIINNCHYARSRFPVEAVRTGDDTWTIREGSEIFQLTDARFHEQYEPFDADETEIRRFLGTPEGQTNE